MKKKEEGIYTTHGKEEKLIATKATDNYPLPEIFPWISSVFVTEEYRGHGISEMMIAFAIEYTKENGFDKTYIPSEHVGLYEKGKTAQQP